MDRGNIRPSIATYPQKSPGAYPSRRLARRSSFWRKWGALDAAHTKRRARMPRCRRVTDPSTKHRHDPRRWRGIRGRTRRPSILSERKVSRPRQFRPYVRWKRPSQNLGSTGWFCEAAYSIARALCRRHFTQTRIATAGTAQLPSRRPSTGWPSNSIKPQVH